MAKKKVRLWTNWDFIQPLYRAGGLSNYEIARQYELTHQNQKQYKSTVSEAAIRDYAKRHNWSRDLTAQVAQRTSEKVLRDELRKSRGGEVSASDEAIIEQAAENRAQVVQIQRRDLAALKVIEEDLYRRMIADEDQVLVGWYEGVASEHRVKMGMLERSRAYREIVTSMSRRIVCERLAWGLDAKQNSDDDRSVEINLNLGPRGEDGSE